jgi:hypothetical protein
MIAIEISSIVIIDGRAPPLRLPLFFILLIHQSRAYSCCQIVQQLQGYMIHLREAYNFPFVHEAAKNTSLVEDIPSSKKDLKFYYL